MLRSTACLIMLTWLVTLLGACASSHRDATPAPDMVQGDQLVTFEVEVMACRNGEREIAHELEELRAAVEHCHVEHLGAKDDANCLDPAKRAERQKQMQAE